MTKEITPAMLRAAAEGRSLADGSPEAIKASEAHGQAEMVSSTKMPLDLDRTAFEALGFKFGEKIDDLFQETTLPPGWTRRGSDHSMWSYIDDETGRERCAVFYKAAFYDRRAFAHLSNTDC